MTLEFKSIKAAQDAVKKYENEVRAIVEKTVSESVTRLIEETGKEIDVILWDDREGKATIRLRS